MQGALSPPASAAAPREGRGPKNRLQAARRIVVVLLSYLLGSLPDRLTAVAGNDRPLTRKSSCPSPFSPRLSAEPVTLAEMKSYLRVEHDDEDALIAQLLAAARRACESATRRAFIAQTWRLTRERWPRDGQIDVALAPLISVTAARIRSVDGAETAIDPARFKVVAGAAPGLILARRPLPAPAVDAMVELDIAAGYGSEPSAVPGDLIEAVRRLAAQFYESRGIAQESAKEPSLPADVAALLAPHRVVSL